MMMMMMMMVRMVGKLRAKEKICIISYLKQALPVTVPCTNDSIILVWFVLCIPARGGRTVRFLAVSSVN